VDSAARSAETVNASHTAGRMSRQPRQRQRYFVSFAARDIGERQANLLARRAISVDPIVALISE